MYNFEAYSCDICVIRKNKRKKQKLFAFFEGLLYFLAIYLVSMGIFLICYLNLGYKRLYGCIAN